MHITSLFSTHCSQLTVLYLVTWRAAKLGIFTHFTFIHWRRCSQSISLRIYALYRSLAAFYECLITLLLYHPLPGQKTCECLWRLSHVTACVAPEMLKTPIIQPYLSLTLRNTELLPITVSLTSQEKMPLFLVTLFGVGFYH